MVSAGQTPAVDAIELHRDAADHELVRAFAAVVRDLALERRDLTDPLTAIEADRLLAEQVAGGAVEFLRRSGSGRPSGRCTGTRS